MNYKNIFKWIFFFFLFFFSLVQVFTDNLFIDDWTLPYCDNDECSYKKGLEVVKPMIDNTETNQTLLEYVQSVIIYLLSFLSIIAVVYIIYAWFKIMIWWWNEETLKKSRTNILHVVIWIVIIWLAYSIVTFIINILNNASTPIIP